MDKHLLGGRAYAISILENRSRAILASAVSPTQDLAAFLSVLYRAVERYGSPERSPRHRRGVDLPRRPGQGHLRGLGGGEARDRAGQALAVLRRDSLQQAEADDGLALREGQKLAGARRGARPWVRDYNEQAHWAHRDREDGRRSPAEVLGWVSGIPYREEDLERAFFSTRFSRVVLNALSYARFRHWRVYGEEGLAGREAALWLQEKTLSLEYGGETLSRYDVERDPDGDRPAKVARPRVFETSHAPPRLRPFGLDETGWLKALKLRGHAARKPGRPQALQEALFPYLKAL